MEVVDGVSRDEVQERYRLDELIVPVSLKPRDVVAIISPSAPGPAWWPHRLERAVSYIEMLGLRALVMPHAAQADRWVSASARARADDIHAAFADPQVRAIVASLGGNHSNQLLPHLDFELIRANPKIFQGYSDTTVLLWAIALRSNLRTYHGPAACLELAEYPAVLPFTDELLRGTWLAARPIVYSPAPEWTEEFLDFFTKADLSRARNLQESPGWVTLRAGMAEGRLIGGCLETICWHLKGSAFWPDFSGTLLFLETSEEAPSPAAVDAYLTDLKQLGVFDQAAGLLIGRPYGYKPEQTERLFQVVIEQTAESGIPVIANVDLGHTDPMLTLPIGARARLDAGSRRFELLESPTRPT
jgi:muramoyltetrapeptide carboxypeptidase